MKHLNERDLSALADGALKGEALWRVQQHLEGCGECRDALAALSARDAALDAALTHDPGEAYFDSFADRVVGRIAEAERAGEAEAPARGLDPGRDMLAPPIRLSWWQRPRALALVGTTAVLVVGAGLVLLMARQAEPPRALSDRSPAARALRQEAGRAETPAAEHDLAAPEPAATEAGRAPAESESPGAADAMSSAGTQAGSPSAPEAAPQDVKTQAAPASPPAPAMAPLTGGTSQREVPRGVVGESRAAPAPGAGLAAPPSAPEAGATTAEKVRELKRAALGPSGQRDQAQKNSLAGEPARAEAPAPAARVDRLAADERAMVCGVARDDAGRPLAGVTVTAADLGSSTTTGADGRFCLSLPAGPHELQLLAVGFQPARLTVDAASAGEALAATLHPVAVLGTGSARGGEDGPTGFARAPAAETLAKRAPAEARRMLSTGDAAFASLPDTLRALTQAAASLQSRAEAGTRAGDFDAAAAAWERLAPAIPGGAPEVELYARLGECRFAAWQRAPDRRRAGRAVEALTRFVARAPAGEKRDRAARWIDQIQAR